MSSSETIPRRPPPRLDRERFRARRAEDWKTLSGLLRRLEASGPRALSLPEARRLGRLYRAACADLLAARSELEDAALADYLDALVARAYAFVYAPSPSPRGKVRRFLWHDFPALVRREVALVALAGLFLAAGAVFGAFVMVTDPDALSVVIPDMHLAHTPAERVRSEGLAAGPDAGKSAVFSSFLFTHNIQVTFLVFALGITWGIGTAFVLFWNGVPLGALAAQYHASDQALFFWAWILPHGVVELLVVMIAGASGFVLARALWLPGARSRRASLVEHGRSAVALVLGGMPMLVVAGVVEGTISQMHAPTMPYWVKLCFAAALLCTTVAYLARRAAPAERAVRVSASGARPGDAGD